MFKNVILLLSTIILLIACKSNKTPLNNNPDKPNILFLFTDDQRYNTINALGNSEIITSNLDQLVNKGTAFTNAYIFGAMNGAVCAPSRAMLMTGRSVFRVEPYHGNPLSMPDTLLPRALASKATIPFIQANGIMVEKPFNLLLTLAQRYFLVECLTNIRFQLMNIDSMEIMQIL